MQTACQRETGNASYGPKVLWCKHLAGFRGQPPQIAKLTQNHKLPWRFDAKRDTSTSYDDRTRRYAMLAFGHAPGTVPIFVEQKWDCPLGIGMSP